MDESTSRPRRVVVATPTPRARTRRRGRSRVAAASCRRSAGPSLHPGAPPVSSAPPPLPSHALAAAHRPARRPSSRLSPLRVAVVLAASSSSRPRQSSASASRPSRSRERSPSPGVLVARPPTRRPCRRSLSSSSPPSSLSPSPSSPPSSSSTLSVTGRAAVVVVRVSVLGRCRSCSPLSVAGCHRVTVVRRPSPPLSSLIYPGPGILVVVGSWLCSPPRCGRRRRRVLCSPPPVGSVSMARDPGGKT